jgi:hypothetical protein
MPALHARYFKGILLLMIYVCLAMNADKKYYHQTYSKILYSIITRIKKPINETIIFHRPSKIGRFSRKSFII